jgi:hypothetical protein
MKTMNTKTRKVLIAIGLGTLLALGSAGAAAGAGGHATAAVPATWYHQ